MKNLLSKVVAELIKISIIVAGVLAGIAVLFPQGKVSLTSDSIKAIDSIYKDTKHKTDSVSALYKDTAK